MKKIGIILLSVLLVVLIAVGSCAALAAAEPEEGVFAGMMGEESIDLTKLFGGLLNGNITLPYPALNHTVQESLAEGGAESEYGTLTAMCMAPTDASGSVWVRTWVAYEGRTWTTTMRVRMEAECGEKGVTGIVCIPEEITVGKLPVPELLWPMMLGQMAEQTGMPCEDGKLRYSLPDMNLGFLQLKDIRAEQEGLVLQFGVTNPWG